VKRLAENMDEEGEEEKKKGERRYEEELQIVINRRRELEFRYRQPQSHRSFFKIRKQQ
jgi:hypothetical protein